MIRRLRIENHLSLRMIAAEIDFDQSTLSKVERNET
ncbi:MAG: helix-turn-helix transcriptional regulator, partial [Bacteroidota bacterium]